MHKDHLGSTRLVTDHAAVYVTDCYDFYPFGEINTPTTPCSSGNNAPSHSNTTHEFTGDERDAESNLDHTLFRQYASSLGRWMHPDPAGLAAVDPTNPQSLNRYAYVLNNPLALVDPLGLDPCQGANNFAVSQAANGTGIFTQDDCLANGGTWSDGFLNGGGGNTPSGNGPPSGADNTPGCVWIQTDPLGIAQPTLNCNTDSSSGGGNSGSKAVSNTSGSTIGPAPLDVLNDYCSARGRAKFIADWVPGGGQLVRNLWSSSMGEKMGFYQLSHTDIARLTSENSGAQTVALHAASEGLKAAAGSTAFLTALRASTGIPKTLASTWLGRISVALIVVDASVGFYKEGKEILNCQAGN